MNATTTESLPVLRAELRAVQQDLDRVDAVGDAGAVVRLRIVLEPRIAQLRRAIADAERLQQPR